MMKKIVVISIFLFFSSSVFSTESSFLNALLNIKSEKYYKTIDGNTFYNELIEYKDLEQLYLQSRKKATKKQANLDDIKFFSFIGFVAYTTNNAAAKEALSSDFIQVYFTNRDRLLSILEELPFLIPSSCYYIAKHFGFEDKFKNDKETFIKDNKVYFTKALNKDNYKKCLSIISSKF